MRSTRPPATSPKRPAGWASDAAPSSTGGRSTASVSRADRAAADHGPRADGEAGDEGHGDAPGGRGHRDAEGREIERERRVGHPLPGDLDRADVDRERPRDAPQLDGSLEALLTRDTFDLDVRIALGLRRG